MEYPRNEELISAYLDRELSPDERAALDRVLEKSPEARERLRELEATSRFLRRLPQRTAEVDFADAVIDRLRSESLLRPVVADPPRPVRRMEWRIYGPLAAAAALLFGVWLVQYEPHRTRQNFAALSRSDEPAAASLATEPAEREQLDVGDAFDVLGPNGESRFRLIVFNVPDGDSVRCLLVDKSDEAQSPALDDPADSQTGVPAASGQPIRALQADLAQIDALEKAYIQANSVVDESLPVVDIIASTDLRVGGVTAHSRPDASADMRVPAVAESSLTESTNGTDLNPPGPLASQSQRPPQSLGRDRLSANETSGKDADSIAGAEGRAAERIGNERARPKDVSGLSSRTERTAPVARERAATRFWIEEVRVQSDNSSQTNQSLDAQSAAELAVKEKKTREGVRKLAASDERRVGEPSGAQPLTVPGRVKCLVQLRLRESSEPEKSDR